MPLHLLKICVGVDAIEELAAWQDRRLKELRRRKKSPRLYHVTRQTPQRAAEIVDGGSLYWIIKGFVRVRQRIIAIEPVVGEDGIQRCGLALDPALVRTHLQPRRPHQGWRYLGAADAPADLAGAAATDLPDAVADELRELGLL